MTEKAETQNPEDDGHHIPIETLENIDILAEKKMEKE